MGPQALAGWAGLPVRGWWWAGWRGLEARAARPGADHLFVKVSVRSGIPNRANSDLHTPVSMWRTTCRCRKRHP